jgi:hypothetical protein
MEWLIAWTIILGVPFIWMLVRNWILTNMRGTLK